MDIVSGEPLFSSLDKYDSGSGWPSFTKPLELGNIVEKEDRSDFTPRTEIRSQKQTLIWDMFFLMVRNRQVCVIA